MRGEEVQRRALAVAMRHPAVIDGNVENAWDELWTILGEELGWKSVALIDRRALREQIAVALESDRMRRAGCSKQEIEARETQLRLLALFAESRPQPGDVFNVFHWVGPLLTRRRAERLKQVQKDGLDGVDYVSVWDFDPRYQRRVIADGAGTASMLVKLGAPEMCRALRLFLPTGEKFAPGSKLPLRQALEIAVDLDPEQDRIVLCLPGRLAYVQTHEGGTSIVYRPGT